jgi:peptide/nickel transport system ATP-binding protein/oligopeptide transport system ATP-binding protein
MPNSHPVLTDAHPQTFAPTQNSEPNSYQSAQVLLEVRQLNKLYPLRQSLIDRIKRLPQRVVKAVNQVNLSLNYGEIVGLMGESGCGKTTLGKLICRLIEPTSGHIQLEGRNILNMSKEELRLLRPRFQMLFQNPYSTLNPKMTVEALLRETLDVNLSMPKHQCAPLIEHVLEKVGLPQKKYSYPSELSGGERRRVGLARLLLLQPTLIIADEPVAGLDASIRARIVDMMLDNRTPQMSYIFISHDLHVIRYVANRVLVMFLGMIVEEVPISAFDDELHHPYTLTLLKAAGQVSLRKSLSQKVDFTDLPSHSEAIGTGCPYIQRCPWAGNDIPHERCLRDVPPLHRVSDKHFIACHRFE